MLTGLVSAAGSVWNSVDPSSYSNIEEVYTDHVHLDLVVNWDTTNFDGKAFHKMHSNISDLTNVFYDIHGIDVSNVYYRPNDTVAW
jgi:hypothetical protein